MAPPAEFPHFPDVAPELGLDAFDLAGGAIVDDLTGDGLFDVMTSTLHPSGRMHFFVNQGGGTFTERGAAANLGGITGGLNLVHADYDNDGDHDVLVGERRSIYRYIGTGGSFGANPFMEHLGVGGASRIEVLEVFWPTTGVTQTFSDVAVDRTIEITEGQKDYKVLPERRFRLGGAAPGAAPE